MKKNLNKLTLFLATPILLASCGGKDVYEVINKNIVKEYKGFEVVVETTKSDLKLTSTYTYALNGDKYKVAYSEESYKELSMDVSGSRISKTEGEKEIEKSKVSFNKFKVETKTYDDIAYDSTGTFTGELRDAKTFLGIDKDLRGVIVTVAFKENTLETVNVSYSANDGYVYSTTYKNFTL